MDEEEMKLRVLELERSHQCSLEIGRGAKNVMTWKAKLYFSDYEKDDVKARIEAIKKDADVLCEVGLNG